MHSYTPVVPSKTTPDSRPKWAKCILVIRPNRCKNPTRWGGTYLYSLYKGVPPSLGLQNTRPATSFTSRWITKAHRASDVFGFQSKKSNRTLKFWFYWNCMTQHCFGQPWRRGILVMGVLASQLKCVLSLLEKKNSQTDLILVTLQI